MADLKRGKDANEPDFTPITPKLNTAKLDIKAEPKSDYKEKFKKTYDEKSFVIRIMPRTLERLIYILIILALIFVFIFQKGCSFDINLPSFEKSNKTAIEQQPAKQVEAPANKTEAKPATKPTVKPETVDTSAKTGEITKSLSFDFEVENEGKKMTSITFTLVNGDVPITPRIKIFWYDADSTDERKSFERGSFTYGIGLNPGQKLTKTLTEADLVSKYFESTEPAGEIIELKLYDLKTNKLIISQTKEVTVS